MRIKFEHPEDKRYFEKLLCQDGDNIEKFFRLFDFRDPSIKRKEFALVRNKMLEKLLEERGLKCEIRYPEICDLTSGIQIDHLIPLSSNKLNKHIRKLKPERGKKVKTQSFGSNDEKNLLIACKNCNGHKKHRFLEEDKLKKIIKARFS